MFWCTNWSMFAEWISCLIYWGGCSPLSHLLYPLYSAYPFFILSHLSFCFLLHSLSLSPYFSYLIVLFPHCERDHNSSTIFLTAPYLLFSSVISPLLFIISSLLYFFSLFLSLWMLQWPSHRAALIIARNFILHTLQFIQRYKEKKNEKWLHSTLKTKKNWIKFKFNYTWLYAIASNYSKSVNDGNGKWEERGSEEERDGGRLM